MQKAATVDTYLESFPEDVQAYLVRIRVIIKEKAPQAVESMAYGMPAYKMNGKPLVYFAAFQNHIGFYATPSGHEAFGKQLSQYKQGKGSVQFPLNQPIPFDLIGRMVAFRVKENEMLKKKR
jgi:uncharacterized protein YdhG (YjbR/CyaY superfamily)